MKRTSLKRLSAVAVVTLSAVTSAHAEELTSYGRAGGPVGAERIRYVATRPQVSLPEEAVAHPGIAGGPVGADRIRYVVATARKSTWPHPAAYPGIAGGPVGADRILWLFHPAGFEMPTMLAESALTK
jgi:hypothetical protein